MKLVSLLIIFVSFSTVTLAQDLSFESEVREAVSGDVVADALVTIEGTVMATRTNDEGVFIFNDPIPVGEYAVSVVKEGFETKYFLIKSQPDVKIIIDFVELELTRKEALKRKKERITLAKQEKKMLKEAKEQNKAKEKRLARETKRLKRKNSVEVEYDAIDNPTAAIDTPDLVSTTETADVLPIAPLEDPNEETDIYSDAQKKYAEILSVSLDQVSNKDLYDEIDKWMGTPYLWGGETIDGIDCSSFSQILLMRGFDLYIERTAEKQFNSKNTYGFSGIKHLKEGDLVFFKGVEGEEEVITHVGVYLHNNMFVHATGSRYNDGVRGVKISNLTDPYWLKKFVGGGRRLDN